VEISSLCTNELSLTLIILANFDVPKCNIQILKIMTLKCSDGFLVGQLRPNSSKNLGSDLRFKLLLNDLKRGHFVKTHSLAFEIKSMVKKSNNETKCYRKQVFNNTLVVKGIKIGFLYATISKKI